MSTNRWVNPVTNNLLRDAEGNLLPGGSLEIYEAGTSTPLTVYSDKDQTASLGATLTADAYGLIPDFHLPNGTQFKAIAKDSGGTTKWTRDYLFTADSNTDTRLDALEASVGALSGVTENGIINGGMRVALGTDLTLTSSFLEGKVNRLYGRVTNVTAGTLTQGFSADYASGAYGHFDGVSQSSSGVVEAQIRIPSIESTRYKNRQVTFSCLVYHDVGSSINYTVTVKKANSADDFSALTTISTGTATAVATGTDTRLTLTVSDMGDCANGIAIEVSAATTASITTKDFRISEAQLELGGSRSGFSGVNAETTKSSVRPGTLVQTVRNSASTVITVNVQTPDDNTTPQNTEGEEIITQAITPVYASSILRVRCIIPFGYVGSGGSGALTCALHRDSTADAVAVMRRFCTGVNTQDVVVLEHEESASSTAATTFKLRCGRDSTGDDFSVGSCDSGGNDIYNGGMKYSITIDEIAQ
jgi:hypothetical protein